MTKKILQVNFKIDLPRKEYGKICDMLSQAIADSKGVLWKIWTIDEASNLAGGIYLFEDVESLNNFLQGDIVKQVASHPAISDLDAKIFDIMEEQCKVTRAPI